MPKVTTALAHLNAGPGRWRRSLQEPLPSGPLLHADAAGAAAGWL